ncbi:MULTISPECIES: DUF302 domain-containing protein [Gemmobacter]|jgi:uncharacterized protein (DUF302 family)|uniref:DUF302 domain-containing protein n=1 Tax=Gemmobacter nanjingensis TaxID=488454 RepID=A0ABQ3F6X0_9RHOB|nr:MULTISPECIES: DUF302 domain-containing protein [Gemmobacter]GHC10615.1 hypothetical protein GCM10007291_03940 [Gemmobacter nanjingensis]
MTLMTRVLSVAALICATTPAVADEFVTATSEEAFEDVTFAVESAIVGRGLVIDSHTHTGDMLERTRADVGSDVVLFDGAEIFLFCSAEVSRKVMEADPTNIRYCPYAITVYQRPGEAVTVGFMHRDEPTMAPVNDLLQGLVADALAG